MAKFEAAAARYLRNIFICKVCKSKMRTTNMRVLSGKVSCRKCKGKALRPVRRK